jgi:hypothetical protein
VIFRLPYKRIVKYVSHEEMNIFTFWILKDTVRLEDLQELTRHLSTTRGENLREGVEERESVSGGEEEDEMNETLGFDPNQYCDCIYLVTESVREISFLFESYFKLCKDQVPPLLPGDVPDEEDEEVTGTGTGAGKKGINRLESFESEMKRKGDEGGGGSSGAGAGIGTRGGASRLNSFFQVSPSLSPSACDSPPPCVSLLLVAMTPPPLDESRR